MDKEIGIKRLEFIKEKLLHLDEDLKLLEENKKSSIKRALIGALERWSEEIIESAIQINSQILDEKGIKSSSYYDSFMQLEILKIFGKKELEKLASTAGFRNRLAHEYMKLDKEITLESIRSLKEIYKNYCIKILEYINKH